MQNNKKDINSKEERKTNPKILLPEVANICWKIQQQMKRILLEHVIND